MPWALTPRPAKTAREQHIGFRLAAQLYKLDLASPDDLALKDSRDAVLIAQRPPINWIPKTTPQRVTEEEDMR